MLAIDTNVIVRFLTGDDPIQARKARTLVDTSDVWVSMTVLLETDWVLRSAYGFSTERVAVALSDFAGLPRVRLADAPLAAQALQWAQQGMDFADALHIAGANACEAFVTFDTACVKVARANRGVTVRKL
jgi:predicted nucleic-acid-binding protein